MYVHEGPANTLDDRQLEKLLRTIEKDARRPVVDRVVYLLSYKAGLRVQEIAGLRWQENVLDPEGNIRHQEFKVRGSKGRMKTERHPVLWVGQNITKGGRKREGAIGGYGEARTIRMHTMLYDAICELRREDHSGPYLIPSGRRGAQQNLRSRAHALRMRVNRFYQMVDYKGCSSHSGRRTFITKAARNVHEVGESLAAVQKLAGHKQLSTTQGYIDITDGQAQLIDFI